MTGLDALFWLFYNIFYLWQHFYDASARTTTAKTAVCKLLFRASSLHIFFSFNACIDEKREEAA